MFNESMQGISTLSYALMNSVNDIIESNTFDQVVSDRSQFVSTDGDIYFPLSEHIQVPGSRGTNKIPSFMPGGDSDEMRVRDFDRFRREYIADSITTVSYNRSISLPTLLKRLAQDPKTYGVIIQKGSYMVNPLHPLVAFSITSGLMELPEEGDLHIFEWQPSVQSKINDKNYNMFDTKVDFFKKEYPEVFGLFKYLIKKPTLEKRKATVSEDNIKRLIDLPLIDDINTEINIDISSNDSTGDSNIKSIIVPTQLAIGNIATPYYGMLLLTDPKSNITGYNLTPMFSGNLNQEIEQTMTFNDLNSRTHDGNVCAGSESSTSPRGWSTLSKVNLNSMFSENIVSVRDVVTFVEASKEISAVIWEGVEKESLDALEEAETAETDEPERQRTVEVG